MEATNTVTVETFGKLRGTHRWARLFDKDIQWGVGGLVFSVTTFTDREAAIAKIKAWIDGAVWNG